jgi:ribonucleoside-diphosphate reductase alpha chain
MSKTLLAEAPMAPSFDLTPPPTATAMRVTKRNGAEPVDLNKIVRAVTACAEGLHAVDPMRVATRTISGLYDGATTRELDELSIRTAALLTGEEPEYAASPRACWPATSTRKSPARRSTRSRSRSRAGMRSA